MNEIIPLNAAPVISLRFSYRAGCKPTVEYLFFQDLYLIMYKCLEDNAEAIRDWYDF